MNHNPLKSKAFWGAVVVAAAKIIADPSPTNIAESIGGILSVIGIRDAIAKNGTGA